MAWVKMICGRLKSDYRYSKDIVYNNFPWPMEATASSQSQQLRDAVASIEQTAQGILDTRAKYHDSTLADLYDDTFMPADLRKAHRENDKAVMQAYGFDPKLSESEIVAELFKMYQKLTEK
ncbi:MAG: methylase [Bacteroidales bacterium]|nr:methylase [Bacteroidales bacterium]